jgi:hypothetical protein
MASHSAFLDGLSAAEKIDLDKRLDDRQSGKCFICDNSIDLVVHQGQLEVDHIEPLAEGGADSENNFALVHSHCNRQKGASDLRVARRMAEFERLQEEARKAGERGANLGRVLSRYGGAKFSLRLNEQQDQVRFAFSELDDISIRSSELYTDELSGMRYFFALLPMEYVHHDDRINPRSIGPNIRGLIEEFMKKRPQLHIALGWWAPTQDGSGPVKVFDGQHKATAQILLGVRRLPVRIFVKPDLQVLLQTNTNAGDKLRQVAFDTAVIRHLGSTLYAERVRQYQSMKGLKDDNYEFSEKDLVAFFRGEHREILRYIVDASRVSIITNKDNHLIEFLEWSGKSADQPLAYTTIERTFFAEFVYKKALSSPIGEGLEQGKNPRQLEKDQNVRLMNLFAEKFFIGQWNPTTGGRQVEGRVQRGDDVPEGHLRAWRVAREEILGHVVQLVRLVIEQYYAWTGTFIEKERLFQYPMPEELWSRIDAFLTNLGTLPCWIDKGLSTTVFGAKRNRDFWRTTFQTGKTPEGVRVLTKALDVNEMIVGSQPAEKKKGMA